MARIGKLVCGSCALGILSVVGFAFQAGAVPLPVGGSVLTPGTTTLPASVVLTNQTVSFTGVAASGATNFSGTLQLQVVKEIGSGTLDFTFQIFNSALSADAIDRLTTGIYTGFATNADWTNKVPAGIGSAFADRNTADTVGFTFANASGFLPTGQGLINPGTNSALLFIKTDATQFTIGTVQLINNATANVLGFAPVPEPSTCALVALAVPFVASLVRRRRKV